MRELIPNRDRLPGRLKRTRNRLLRRVFETGQRAHVDILPRHYYSSIPDVRRLRTSNHWRAARSMLGVAGADPDDQLAFVADCCPPELREHVRRAAVHPRACNENGAVGYGPIEAEFLYCFIATKLQPRIVQVGAGVSTSVILAGAAHAGYRPEITCIDPFPGPFLLEAERRGDVHLVPRGAEEVELDVLADVGPGGLLFVDSTHTVRPGSEVNRIVLEVLPRLPPGSYTHFHDITFPYDYPRDLLTDALFFWNESPLLHAFLIGNDFVRLRVAMSMLHYLRPDELREHLPNYRPDPNDYGLHRSGTPNMHFPSATYLATLG